MDGTGARSEPASAESREGTRLEQLIAAAAAAVEHDVAFARVCLVQARDLMRRGGADGRPAERGRLARWQVRRVTAYVDAHLAGHIRVSDLALQLGISTGHFSRAFGRTCAMTPREFVAMRRMARAQQLMRDTTTPLAQIALECGLCDQSHFTRMFRRVVGMSPRAWRRSDDRADAPLQS